jgi:hypothetical protein
MYTYIHKNLYYKTHECILKIWDEYVWEHRKHATHIQWYIHTITWPYNTYIHTHTHTHTHTLWVLMIRLSLVNIDTHTHSIHVHTLTHTYIYIHTCEENKTRECTKIWDEKSLRRTKRSHISALVPGRQLKMVDKKIHVCMYVNVYVYVYVYVCVYIYDCHTLITKPKKA